MNLLRYCLSALPLLLLPGLAAAQVAQPNASQYTVTATGTTAAQTLANGMTRGCYDIRGFTGVTYNGSTDDTAAINTAITAVKNAGGGAICLPAGSVKAGGVVMQYGVSLIGAGANATFLKCSASPCITQPAATQLSGVRLTDINIKPASGTSGTVLSFPIINQSEIGRLLIEGFTTSADLIHLGGGGVATTISDSNLGSNIIWNNIHDVTVYGCATCVSLEGHYGSTPTVSPASSANQPDQVLTQNVFTNVNIFYATAKCWDIIRAVDTNTWHGGLCNISANTGGVAVAHGDDSGYTGNTYVNSNKFFGLAISKQSNVTALTFFSSQNYSFALEAYGFETDIDTSAAGVVPVSMSTAQSYRLCGKRLDTGASISNLYLGCQEKGVAWTATNNAAPSTGFVIAVPPSTASYGITGSGTLAAGQFQMPCGAPDRHVISFWASGVTVTSLTVASCSGAGSSIAGSNGTISPTTPMAFRYIAASNFWVRN